MNQNSKTSWIIKAILFLWFLRIFKPEWIISYFIPSLKFLKTAPTILIFVFLIYIIFSPKKIQYDKPILCFLLVTFFSTFFSANRGISVDILRGISETFIIYSIIKTVLSSDKDINKLFTLYLLAFTFFGIWGILGGGKIRAFLPLDNEDAFGPYMCMGIPFAYYTHLMKKKGGMKILCFLLFIVCIIGVVSSFARGSFIALSFLLFYIFLRSNNKSRILVYYSSIAIIVVVSIVFSPKIYNAYKNEMSTIWQEGTEEQTAHDRVYLWTKAWDMFADNPLIGVGPNCYGFHLPKYSDSADARGWGVRRHTYGRHVHNIFIQIMAEMGILGFLSFFALLYCFWKSNKSVRVPRKSFHKNRHSQDKGPPKANQKNYHYYSLALEIGMIAFLLNGLFYNLLFFTWFWDLLILNTLISLKSKAMHNNSLSSS